MLQYTDIADAAQQALGRRIAASPDILNIPGQSLACKIDPFYYLAPCPGFVVALARWSGVLPKKLRTALIKTGDLLTSSAGDNAGAWCVPVRVVWGRGLLHRTMNACLVHASFIDRAATLYGGMAIPPVSDMQVAAACRAGLDAFLEGRTPVASLAFARQD
ncbi:MAG: hypothetical protein AB7E47_16125 [Desulfovibrionaceae bacterium]